MTKTKPTKNIAWQKEKTPVLHLSNDVGRSPFDGGLPKSNQEEALCSKNWAHGHGWDRMGAREPGKTTVRGQKKYRGSGNTHIF